MEITVRETDQEEYSGVFRKSGNLFDSVAFTLLNSRKAQEGLAWLILESGGKPRLGLVAARRGDMLHAPFSAPYSFFRWNKAPSLQTIYDSAEALARYLRDREMRLRWVLPPLAHYPDEVQACWASLLSNGARQIHADYNLHLPLGNPEDVTAAMTTGGRNQWRISLREGVEAEVSEKLADPDLAEAYSIISENHRMKGFPMRMSLDDYMNTAPLANARVAFASIGGKRIAAAIFFEVRHGEIMQAISWGDLREHSHLRPMNALLVAAAREFAANGFSMLDMGPSSEDGIPALGQVHFKQEIGARLSMKPALLLG